MAANVKLTAELRTERGKGAARRLRAAGRIPAVVYGHNEETRHLSLDHHEVQKLFSRIPVESTIIDLQIRERRRREVKALVREVQMHPFRSQIHHVDFYQVHADEPVDVEVPVRLTGTPEGVKEGGILQQVLNELPIRCLPDRIPEAIEADVSALEVGDSLHVSDLAIPEGVDVEIDLDRSVCSVLAPTVPVVEEEVEEVEVVPGEVEPELIRKRPEEEEQPPAAEAGEQT